MAPIPNLPSSEPQSPPLFHIERISQYVSLPPASLATPLPSLCASLFSPLLLTYFSPARGIVLAYQDVDLSDEPPGGQSNASGGSRKRGQTSQSHEHSRKRRRVDTEQDDASSSSSSEDEGSGDESDAGEGRQLLCKVIDEYSASFLWATASFLVFRPVANANITCRVTHQFSSHIALTYLNSFPISILKSRLPKDWSWTSISSSSPGDGAEKTTQELGYWVDGDGAPIDEVLEVRIRDFEVKTGGSGRAAKGHFKIEASLISDEEEKERASQQQDSRRRKEKQKENGNGVDNGVEKTVNGTLGGKGKEKAKKSTKGILRTEIPVPVIGA